MTRRFWRSRPGSRAWSRGRTGSPGRVGHVLVGLGIGRHLFLMDDDLTPAEQARPRRRRPPQEGPVRRPAARGPRRSRSSSRSRRRAPGCRSRSASPSSAATRSSSTRARTQLGRGETIEDTAPVLSRYVARDRHPHVRPGPHRAPRRGGERARRQRAHRLRHPCQALADLQTIRERKGGTVGPDADLRRRRQQHGALAAARRLRWPACTSASPRRAGYQPIDQVVRRANEIGERDRRRGRRDAPTRSRPPTGADVLYTDVWASMGQEGEAASRARVFRPYALDERARRRRARRRRRPALPARAPRRGDRRRRHRRPAQSSVWDQAENRLHAQKALLAFLLEQG